MHKYMRAIGFSEYTDRKKLKELLTDVIMNSDHRAYTMNQEGILLGEFSKNHTATRGAIESGTFGVAVCGEFDDNDKFIYEYYFPYLTGSGITSYEDVSVERHADKDSYAGICDDIKVGISLIFYLRNRIPYIKAQSTGKLPIRGTTLTLSGLSLKGSILLPIKKDEEQVLRVKKDSANRNKLLAAARQGDEDAIETLTLEDMDMYTTISRKIQKNDIYVRSNKTKSSELSSKLICLITAVGVIYNSSAALLKLPASATFINVSICGLYTIPPPT